MIDTREIRQVVRRLEREESVTDPEAGDRVSGLLGQLPFTDKDVDLICDMLDPEDVSQMDHEAIARAVVRRANGDDDDGLAGVPAKLPQ